MLSVKSSEIDILETTGPGMLTRLYHSYFAHKSKRQNFWIWVKIYALNAITINVNLEILHHTFIKVLGDGNKAMQC
ncbi:MAG: hypothetical protein IPL23_24120 [Saprospiraceae bacterium]|nr:hypothetical protein [Saprospiraceae bacterium]